MSKKLLIDSTQSEETRLAVLDHGKLADYDYESSVRKQLKGNVFLAKVTRVEPSLQAAFVNYGGNRHGFLPFSEIHPDYFRIPVADKQALLEEEERIRQEMEAEALAEEEAEDSDEAVDTDEADDDVDDENDDDSDDADDDGDEETAEDAGEDPEGDEDKSKQRGRRRGRYGRRGRGRKSAARRESSLSDDEDAPRPVDRELLWKRMRRSYKIQEVIKRGQIMLIQVTKEERGNKGAAVTSYVTLPGRYCVLMPNSPQGGGVSRKVSDRGDRKKMRELLRDLDVPTGMAVILRTAGVSRTKAEVKRDLDYLMRLWNQIREDTMQANAPELIYEEASLIKRAIRDVYDKDMNDVLIAGEDGYKQAKAMMKLMMPSHERKVKLHKEETPLFTEHGIEDLIEDMDSPTVTLKSGGYLVINPTEALVSIDVNSGRSTRERHIDETALNTNLEAAEEVARQLRLRDLAGLVVIDFIDMDSYKHNRQVERRLKESMSNDRARVQIGRISNFGLMELSRQRLRASLNEATFETCPSCNGAGLVKTTDGMALSVIRKIERAAIRMSGSDKKDITISLHPEIALYLFNHKRPDLALLEERYGVTLAFNSDECTSVMDVVINGTKVSGAGKEETKQSGGKDGGRNRNRNRNRGGRNKRNNNDSDNQQAQQDNQPAEDTPSEDTAEAKPKRGRRKKSEDTAPQAESKTAEEGVSQEKPDDTAEAAPKKRRAPAKKAATKKDDTKAEDSKADKTSESEEKPKAKRAPRKTATKKTTAKKDDDKADTHPEPKPAEAKTIPIKEAVNDDDSPKDYEVVNQKPKEKKKGWWSKIVE